jgi:soluble lytic murein transglycosylase-like protein
MSAITSTLRRAGSLLAHKPIKRGFYRGIDQLNPDTAALIHHENPQPFISTETADAILRTIAR